MRFVLFTAAKRFIYIYITGVGSGGGGGGGGGQGGHVPPHFFDWGGGNGIFNPTFLFST